MHQSVESDPVRGRGRETVPSVSGREAERWDRPTQRRSDDTSLAGAVFGFIQQHPVVAAGAALAAGAAVAMAFCARRSEHNRLDRRAMRAARSMERTFAREMRNLRHSDMADRMGRFGSSLGEAFSRVDLTPLAERGRGYLEAARSRFGL